jgi:hypothetical protein
MTEGSSSNEARGADSKFERREAESAVNMLGSFTLGIIQLTSGVLLAGGAIGIGIVAVAVARRSWDEVPDASSLLTLGATTAVSLAGFRWSSRIIGILRNNNFNGG